MKITFKNHAAMRDYFIFIYTNRRYIPIHIIKQTPPGRIYDPQINKYVKVYLKVDHEDN